MVAEVCSSPPEHLRTFVLNHKMSEQWHDGHECLFHSIMVFPAVGERSPENAIFYICTKVAHMRSLVTMSELRWARFFGPCLFLKGCRRSLYNPPIDKRTGDLQWRILHGVIAMNWYLAHIDPCTAEGCLFCGQMISLSNVQDLKGFLTSFRFGFRD